MISVVTPIRGRFEMTCDMLKSIYGKASNPNNIENIMWVDDNDPELCPDGKLRKDWPDYPNFSILVGEQRLGYGSLDIMVNTMCKQAKGDYIITFGNDAEFLTQNWDEKYESVVSPDDCAVINFNQDGKNGKATQFPLITRATYDLLGHYCLSPSIDDYIVWVGIMARCLYSADVDIKHTHYAGDYIAVEKEKRVPTIQREFWSEPMLRSIWLDAKKLCEYMGHKELRKFYGWDKK